MEYLKSMNMILLQKKHLKYLQDYRLFILLGLLAVFPFILLSFFNNPATDDYYFAYYTKTYSIKESPFWMYFNVGGRYFANTILCLSPIYFGCLYWYKIVPILLLLLFCCSVYTFVSSLFEKMSFVKKTAIVGLIVALFLFQLPDTCSAFYWMPGSITNQLPISINLLAFSFLIRYYRIQKIKFFLLSVLLFFMALGCNEITVIITLMVLYFILFYKILILKKIDKSLLFITLFTTFFTVIEIAAPGNVVRAKAIPVEHDLVYSLTHALIASLNYLFKWLPLILVFCLFFIETMYKKITLQANRVLFIHPLLASLVLLSILFFGFFPGFWFNHDILPDRAINTIYFYFIVGVIYWIACLLNYLQKKHHFTIELNQSTKYALGSIIILLLFSNTPIYKAYYDLANGKAYHYNQEVANRIKIIENSTTQKVVVPALINQPETIFKPIIMGLTTDKNDWKNEETSIYFNKEILVKPTDSVFTE